MRLLFLAFVLLSTIFLSSVIFMFFFNNQKAYVVINGKYFNTEIAKTDKQKAVGLSKYNKIENNFGMLFPYQTEDYYSFWMKNMKFPIDIIYIRKNKISTIFKNVDFPKNQEEELIKYTPDEPSDLVFEINGGLSDKYNFKIGNNVKIVY
ncbi:MAG: DUF192 domain-containing protein [Candidatus Levybacteria bacterium]|nr:DUF192 domain-containing protein [Candidatus Levybacteria bacterium]